MQVKKNGKTGAAKSEAKAKLTSQSKTNSQKQYWLKAPEPTSQLILKQHCRLKKGRQHAAAEMLVKEQVKKNGKHPVKARGQMGRSGEACERR